MVVMTEASWKAWQRMSDFGWEINLCIREQFPSYMDGTNKQQIMCLEIFDTLVNELCSSKTVAAKND